MSDEVLALALAVVLAAAALAVAGAVEEALLARSRRRAAARAASSPWTLERHRLTVSPPLPLRRARLLWREWRTRHDITDGESLVRRIDRLTW